MIIHLYNITLLCNNINNQKQITLHFFQESLTVLDNEYQCYQRVRYEETELEIEDEVDILMSSDILAAQMSTKSINFVRAQSGWIFREDKTVIK